MKILHTIIIYEECFQLGCKSPFTRSGLHHVSDIQFTRQEKHLKILLPSGPVHFQLPPLKYYLPKFMHALLMPYQLHNLPGTVSNE